jgi:hypothetical protein
MRSHICSSPGSQIFYVVTLLTESRIVADRLLRQIDSRVFPLVFEFSPKDGQSNLILGIISTPRFHLLTAWMRIKRGSREPADLLISFILTQRTSIARTSIAACKKEFTVLNERAPITPVRVSHYAQRPKLVTITRPLDYLRAFLGQRQSRIPTHESGNFPQRRCGGRSQVL